MTDFIFFNSEITADSDCSYEIKWHLILGRKTMTNLDNILKRRDITLLTKICIVKASDYVSVWALDHKEDCGPKNWCFVTVVLEKTLQSPFTARRSSQWILNEINLEYSLEGLLLKPQHLGCLMQRADSLEKTMMMGKNEGRRRRGWQRMR